MNGSIYVPQFSADDSAFALTHTKDQSITVECIECGTFIPFRLDTRHDGVHIQIGSHKCPEQED
jgi:uncharacterized Zn finger protein